MIADKALIDPLAVLAHFSWKESADLEFKSAKGGLPKDLWETYSAMANTQGGHILLGVQNDGEVSGVDNIIKIKNDFWNTINNKGKVSVNLLQDNDVQEFTHPKGMILIIRIPRALRKQCPIYVGLNPLTGTYRRNSEGDYHCTEQEVRRMLADHSEEPADSKILEQFSLNDLDLSSFHQYRQRFASRQPDHPWLDEDDKGLLRKINGWRYCRSSNVEGLTVAGLLMFGREEAIREALPQYYIDFREKLSLDPLIRWTDRLTLDGTWSGNLYQFYLRVIQKLSLDLKLPFQLDDNLVRKGETIVHIAIREALVNTLIHADYQGEGGVIIEKYQDRFEFSNPGSLLISRDQLFEGGVSECRNKSLQLMFTFIGAAEKAGSGIDKIRSGWKSQHWRSPLVRENSHPTRVVWSLPMINLIPKDSLDRLKTKFGLNFSKFNQLEVQALVTAEIETYVDNARMRQITNCHSTDITKILQGLVGQGALQQDSQERWSRYSLPTNLHSVHNDFHSVHNDFHSVHSDQFSEEKWGQLQEIASTTKTSKRLPPKEMEHILLKLCNNHWLTRKQLSTLVGRNSDGLRSRYLTPMVEHGLLHLRYPDKPNRTDQAYQTVSEKTLS